MPIQTDGRARRHAALGWTVVACLVVARAPGGVAWDGVPMGSGSAESCDACLPSGSVSLEQAVAAALLRNPELAIYPFEIRAREARALQEGLLPNPSLGTEVENVGRFGGDEGRAEGSQVTVSLSQLLELGGKRRKRAAVARLEGRLADWDYARARLDTATRTRKAFVAALLAQERVRVAERLVGLARETVRAVGAQVDAGVGSPVERTRAETSVAQARVTLARRQREAGVARVALASTWGSATPTFTRIEGSLEPLGAPPPLGELRAGLGANPDMARWDTAVLRAVAGVALEESRRIPDVTVRVGSRRFVAAETNAFVAELSVPLPLLDRNQGAVDEAYARLARVHAEERAAAAAADAALVTAYEEVLAAYEQARELRAGVLPRTHAALAGTRRGYAEGVLRSLDVLDAQRAVAEAEGEYLEALARYHVAAADLARLAGMPVAAAGARPSDSPSAATRPPEDDPDELPDRAAR